MTVHRPGFHYRLTDGQVAEIRIKWKSTRHLKQGDPDKVTYEQLMNTYSVGRNTIWKVINGLSYTHVVVVKVRGTDHEYMWTVDRKRMAEANEG